MVTVQTMTALAAVLRRRGALAPAVAQAREALGLAEERLRADHPDRGAAEAELGLALAASGDPEAGTRRFRDGVNTVASRIGAGHPTTRALCAAAATAGATVSDGPAACIIGDARRGRASGRR